MRRRLLTSCSDGLSFIKIRIHIAYVAIGVTYVVVMATLLGACQPFNHYWQINPNPGGKSPMMFVLSMLADSSAIDQCMPATSKLACYVVVVLNILTDLYLLHIPILVRCQIFPRLLGVRLI
jgi:hypothetical protein